MLPGSYVQFALVSNKHTHTHFHWLDCIVNDLTVIFSCFIFPSYCSQEVRYQIIPPDLSPPPTLSSWALSESQTPMSREHDDYPPLTLGSLLAYEGIKMCA